MTPMNRKPTHPGEVLREDFLYPANMTMKALAKRIGLSAQHIRDICHRHRSVTARTAILLSEVFGNTPQFWMNLQTGYDLFVAGQKLANEREALK